MNIKSKLIDCYLVIKDWGFGNWGLGIWNWGLVTCHYKDGRKFLDYPSWEGVILPTLVANTFCIQQLLLLWNKDWYRDIFFIYSYCVSTFCVVGSGEHLSAVVLNAVGLAIFATESFSHTSVQLASSNTKDIDGTPGFVGTSLQLRDKKATEIKRRKILRFKIEILK